jgi:hypothetical protein
MHRNFAAWYSIVSPDLNAVRLDARWKAVVEIAKKCNKAYVPDLVRTFYSRPAEAAFVEALRVAIRDADKTYIMNNDRVELAVISGAAIAHTLEGVPSADSDALALSILSMEFGERWTERLPDIVDEAAAYLNKESVRVRENQTLVAETWDSNEWKQLLAGLSAKGVAGDVAGLATGLDQILTRIGTALQVTPTLSGKLQEVQDRYQEKSDMLWWLITEHAISTDSRFADLKAGEVSFVLARDLWTLTRLQPGPLAAPALLKKLLGTKKLIAVGQAIDSLDLTWRQQWSKEISESQKLGEVCPCLYSLCKSVEAGGTPDWRAACRNVTGLDPELRVQPWRLAHQIYRELEVLGCLKN